MTEDINITLVPGQVGRFYAPAGESFATLWRSPDGRYVKVRASETVVEPPPPPPPETGTGLVISPEALAALPMSGAAWDSLAAKATGSWGLADLTNQDNKHCVGVLAGAFVAARRGDANLREQVIAGIEAATGTERDGAGNSILSLGRQLGAYVIAADLVGYRDPAFVAWLSDIRTRELGGHSRWGALRHTAGDTSNNWGTFALASVIAADAYLGDTPALEEDWDIFAGYGDGWWTFNKTASYDEAWQGDAPGYFAINPPGTKGSDGRDLSGCPVEDASRASYPTGSSYIHEAMQGYVVQALLLSRQGFDAWAVNERQVLRAAQFADRFGRLNDHSVGYYVAHLVNAIYGTSLPEKTPTSGGRVFGFTDWL